MRLDAQLIIAEFAPPVTDSWTLRNPITNQTYQEEAALLLTRNDVNADQWWVYGGSATRTPT
jgi:hypothetical protein